jgi:hypothetical protein
MNQNPTRTIQDLSLAELEEHKAKLESINYGIRDRPIRIQQRLNALTALIDRRKQES